MSFLELLQTPGVEEVLELGSSFGIMAFHGGLEGGTVEVAREAAARSGASLYMVVQPPDLRWHVPSHRVVAEGSATLAQFLDHVHVVIAVHGYGRRPRPVDVLLGGRNRLLAAELGRRLRSEMPGYRIVDDLDRVPTEMRGLHPGNPVNQPPDAGVQLELPPRARGAVTAAGDPCKPHPGIAAALVATVADYSTSKVPPARQ